MRERDPFEQLRDLIDQTVAPDARFAADLKSQLMSGLAASGEHSREEEQQPVDIPYRPALVAMPGHQPKRRFKPLILLEIAAVAALLIGIAAAIGSGMFSSDPDDPATIPAAALQDDSAATPTSLPPTVVPPSGAEETRDAPSSGTMEPTVVPPAGLLWQLPLPEGEALDYGGMAVHNGVIYRLLAISTFVGVEAVDSATGGVLWKQNADWDGFGGISADDNGVYYFATSTSERGAGQIYALSPDTGETRWFTYIPGLPRGQVADNGTLFVVDEMNTTTAIDTADGSVAWQFVNAESEALPAGPETIAAYGSGLPVASDTTVVTLTTGGDVIAIDRESGEELWRKSGFHGVASHLTLAEEVLVVLSAEWWDGKDATPAASPETTTRPAVVNGAYGLNLSDGTTLWEQHIAGPVHKPAVSGTTVAFIGIPSGLDEEGPETPQLEYEVSRNITAINVETGVVVWTTPTGANLFMEIDSWTSEDGQSSLFVAGSSDGVKFWSLTGEEKYSGAGAQEYFINDLVTGNGVLVATLADGTLVGIDPNPLASLYQGASCLRQESAPIPGTSQPGVGVC